MDETLFGTEESAGAVIRWCFVNKVFRKIPALESYFYEGSGVETGNFIENKLQQRCFPVNLVKFLRTHIFVEYLRTLASESVRY